MALLHLMHGFCAFHGAKLRAVTVNHGLRAEAASEAQHVARACARLGVRHDILLWDDWDGHGNLQAAARKARYGAIADWARRADINVVALGHTADDQAETVLMRLARGSGVNGLSGIRARLLRNGINWVRPLLQASGADLRAYLRDKHIDWCEDPSNQDTTFDRIKMRRALEVLAPLGIDARALSAVAHNMADARRALDWQTFLAARDIATVDAGAVVLSEHRLRLLPDEIQRRLLVQAITWVSGSEHPPRRGAVATLMAALRKGQAGTADGCHARRVAGSIWVFRELNAVRDAQASHTHLWDDRWRLSPPSVAAPEAERRGLTVRALGIKGLEQCPDWRASGRPHAVLLSTPAIWRGDKVVAAPLAGHGENWHADVEGGAETFFAGLLPH